MALTPTPMDIFGPSNFARAPELLLQPQPTLPVDPALDATRPATPLTEVGAEPVVIQSAIDKLKPGSELHQKVFAKLNAMYKFSEDEMKKHYSRWNFNEQKIQAYTNVNDYKVLMENLQADNAMPPEPVQVIVPYSYATIHAAATFLAQVLLGRKPVFPLLATRGTETERARYMEIAIQTQIDYNLGYEKLWQIIWDSLVYDCAPLQIGWEERNGKGIRYVAGVREQVTELVYAGNALKAIDPYRFFPDPRVPMSECHTKGDFMFTNDSMSETSIKMMEKQGALKWTKEAMASSKTTDRQTQDESRRRVKIGLRGEDLLTPSNVIGFHKVKEGTVRLIPKDWGLSDTTDSEIYKFTIIGQQIVQAEPLNMIHDKHNIAVAEPTSFGHDFMSVAMADMIGPFQDILSWLVSSRMENVRTAINNQFIVDPGRVEINDIRTSVIGRVIRLKQSAMGLPIQQAIQQLQVSDVTGGHLADIQTMRILADTITGVNDNMRGIQTAGGRRSATEARMSMEAGASRLSQLAIRLSSQCFHPTVQQMISNTQQFMPPEMWVEMTGDDGSSTQITPEMLVGNFNYQVSDGTLPFDKTAMIEVWKEILFGVARDPELRQGYDLGKIFNYVAELGGAKNIDSFKKAPMPPQIHAGAAPNPGADPNMVPIGPAMPTNPFM